MAYIGNNPKLKSIVSSGDTLANLTAEPRKAGRLAYATDEGKFYYDNGTALSEVGSGGFNAVDTKANLNGLAREQGKIYYATDEDKVYTDDGTSLNELSGSGIPLLNKGSIVTSDGSVNGELTAGNDGEVLIADSAESVGLRWGSVGGGGLPAGSAIPYGGSTAPTGFLICDGSLLDRTVYADLFAAIGTAFGAGDGSTTFAIPDLRGRFVRGRANGSGLDPDRASRTAQSSGGNTGDNVGSVQSDAFGSHSHSAGSHTHAGPSHNHNVFREAFSTSSVSSSFPFAAAFSNQGSDNSYSMSGFSSGTPTTGRTSTASGTTGSASGSIGTTGSNETRPENIYFNYIIKY